VAISGQLDGAFQFRPERSSRRFQPIIEAAPRHNRDSYRPGDDSGRVGLAFSALASSGGRAGLKRFDKSRIDAGTPHGLPRVTVNGISAPRATGDGISVSRLQLQF